jgi:type II secretory pathway component GspD/PulD (secretin)
MCCRALCLALLLSFSATAGLAQEGAAQSKDRVVKVLRTSNKAQTNDYVAAVYNFENVNPYAIINYFASGLIREAGGIYSFLGPDGASGKVLVIAPEYQLETFSEMAEQLDVKDLTSAPGSAYKYIHLDHRSAVDPGFLDVLRQYASFNSVVLGDVETNSVFIWDSHSGANYAEEAIKNILDKPAQQVVVEVKIYEISSTNDGRLGLDYEAWKNGPGRSLFEVGSSGAYFRHWDPDFRNTRTQYGNSVLIDYPSEFFDFLVEKGRAKALTRTELAALTNEPATLFVGDSILYFREYFDSGNRQVEVAVQNVNPGVSLSFTPTVGTEMVNLDLAVKVVNHLGYDEHGTPKTGTRTIEQEVRAGDGEEVMLGGFSRMRTISEVQKIPVLGSIPVLGYLFGGETESVENTTVVIALRPKIKDALTNYTDEHDAVAQQVAGTAKVSIPETPVGFDQWLFEK